MRSLFTTSIRRWAALGVSAIAETILVIALVLRWPSAADGAGGWLLALAVLAVNIVLARVLVIRSSAA